MRRPWRALVHDWTNGKVYRIDAKHQFCRQKVVQFNSNESRDWAERPEVAIINRIHYAKAATALLPRAATLLDKHK